MAYYSDKATDDEIKTLERDIASVYKQAAQDVADTSAKYFANFEDRYAREYAAYLKGEGGYSDKSTAKQKFDNWYMAQVGRGEKWEALRDQLAQRMTDANKVAASYINDRTPGIYSLNANYEAYQIYNSTGVDFNLVDEQTVKGLMTGKTKILPESRVDIPVDEKWNQKQLTNALLGGILQGKGIGDIATSFQNVANMDRNSALRNARTSMTGAQNAGRQATYEAATEMGIEVKKEWIATEDDRTRESHAELDGVQVPYDEEFPNGLMYPGDKNGDPSEVYNCRCTMRAIIPKYNSEQRTSEIEGHEGDHTKETYEEWLKRKEAEKAEKERNQKPWTSAQASAEAMESKEKDDKAYITEKINAILGDEYAETVQIYSERMDAEDVEKFNNIFDKAEIKTGAEFCFYDPITNEIKLKEEALDEDTLFHEGTHWLDYQQKYKIIDDWGHYSYKYNDDGEIISKEWIPKLVTIKENASFSEKITWDWTKIEQDANESKLVRDMNNAISKLGISGNFDIMSTDIKADRAAMDQYLSNHNISKYDKDYSHLSDFISAMTYDENLGSLTTGGHTYSYWLNDENKVSEITAGYNILKSLGRYDIIAIEEDLAPNLMEMIETEWAKVWNQ